MANIQKHPKQTVEQIDQGDFSEVPTCARSPHVVGQYIKNRHNDGHSRTAGLEGRTRGVILQLEDIPATPGNLERMRERVRQLNRRLAESGAPFRLRVV